MQETLTEPSSYFKTKILFANNSNELLYNEFYFFYSLFPLIPLNLPQNMLVIWCYWNLRIINTSDQLSQCLARAITKTADKMGSFALKKTLDWTSLP